MGLLWRVLAPRGLKQARRALHPGWIIEDAIVHSVRGSSRRRSSKGRPRTETFKAGLSITSTETGEVREISCTHAHRSPETARECGEKMWREWHRGHPGDTLAG